MSVDIGSLTFGVEIIVYWDETVCGGGDPIVAIYMYGGGSVDALDLMNTIDPIISEVKENMNLIKSGTMEALTSFKDILKNNLSISVSGVLVTGNEIFKDIKSYSGSFFSANVNVSKFKGALFNI